MGVGGLGWVLGAKDGYWGPRMGVQGLGWVLGGYDG